jgi:hypothetical protein
MSMFADDPNYTICALMTRNLKREHVTLRQLFLSRGYTCNKTWNLQLKLKTGDMLILFSRTYTDGYKIVLLQLLPCTTW